MKKFCIIAILAVTTVTAQAQQRPGRNGPPPGAGSRNDGRPGARPPGPPPGARPVVTPDNRVTRPIGNPVVVGNNHDTNHNPNDGHHHEGGGFTGPRPPVGPNHGNDVFNHGHPAHIEVRPVHVDFRNPRDIRSSPWTVPYYRGWSRPIEWQYRPDFYGVYGYRSWNECYRYPAGWWWGPTYNYTWTRVRAVTCQAQFVAIDPTATDTNGKLVNGEIYTADSSYTELNGTPTWNQSTIAGTTMDRALDECYFDPAKRNIPGKCVPVESTLTGRIDGCFVTTAGSQN